MRNAIGVAALGALVALVACGGSDGAQGPAGPAGSNGGSGGDGGPAPSHAPAGLSFEDDDYAQGSVSGTITVQKASDESDVTSYAVYWGSSATDKLDLTPIFEVKTTGQDISFRYEGLVPPGATTLLAFAKNPNGESATPPATAGSVDHYLVQVDITSADAGFVTAPVIALDTTNRKVVAAIQDSSDKPMLVICNYDGTGCTQKDISAGQPANSMLSASIAIDATNGKVHIAAVNGAVSEHLGYFTCGLDGSGCTYADLSAATSQGAVANPDIAIDPATNQLWVSVRNDGSSSQPDTFHCALDATGCTHHVAALGANTAQSPVLAVDVAGNQLWVLGTNAADASGDFYLLKCAADATACANEAFADEFLQFLGPSIAIDPPSHRLYVASKTQTDSDVLTVCDSATVPGYNACTPIELFQGDQRNIESVSTSVKFDPVHQKVLLATSDAEDGYRGAFYRCNADGSNCKKSSLSAKVGGGIHPKIAVDPATGEFVIGVEDRGGETEGITEAGLVFLK